MDERHDQVLHKGYFVFVTKWGSSFTNKTEIYFLIMPKARGWQNIVSRDWDLDFCRSNISMAREQSVTSSSRPSLSSTPPATMAFVEGQASSSKGPAKSFSKGNAKGKGGNKPKQPLVKTNQAKRNRQNDELRELQERIDSYVS
jgi:hypothetical protein